MISRSRCQKARQKRPRPISKAGFSVISSYEAAGEYRDGVRKSRRHSGRDCRGGRFGHRIRVLAGNGQGSKTGSKDRSADCRAAAGQGACGERGAAISLEPRKGLTRSPCETPSSSPCCFQRRRRCFIAPALGRPLNSLAAPDVRAPSVRGRWHFKAPFGRFYPPRIAVSGNSALASPEAIGYTLAA
jgi:hypothetical protein